MHICLLGDPYRARSVIVLSLLADVLESLYYIFSYLKSLVPSFNECVDVFLDKIRPMADGSTPVPIRQHLTECTLYVISKVGLTSISSSSPGYV